MTTITLASRDAHLAARLKRLVDPDTQLTVVETLRRALGPSATGPATPISPWMRMRPAQMAAAKREDMPGTLSYPVSR